MIVPRESSCSLFSEVSKPLLPISIGATDLLVHEGMQRHAPWAASTISTHADYLICL